MKWQLRRLRQVVAWYARAWWRELRVRWDRLMSRLERWWKRHLLAPNPIERLDLRRAVVVPWSPERTNEYEDGRADLWVRDLGPGWEPVMVQAYLDALRVAAPTNHLPNGGNW